MRVTRRAVSGIGDFVGGSFAVPQNPVGMGDFVPGWFALPQNPVAGMGDCSCGGSCGPCKSRGTSGMGQITDWSLQATDIGAEIGLGTVPNYVFYGVAAFAAYMFFFETSSRPRYTRR